MVNQRLKPNLRFCQKITARSTVSKRSLRTRMTYLGILSSFGAGDISTDSRLAYPLEVLVSLSMASNIVQDRVLHFESPVTRQRMYNDSIV